MYFSSWVDFINMGGHGLYVWSSYAVALLVVVYNVIAPIRHRRRIKTQVLRQERLDAARKKQTGVHSKPVLNNAVGGIQ